MRTRLPPRIDTPTGKGFIRVMPAVLDDVMGDRHDAALVGASQDRKPDCRGEELGEERDDVDA